jgi:anti-sigma factor RsiW
MSTQPESRRVPPSPATTAVESELVAYLDGELAPAMAEAVEKRLALDPDYRRKLHDLQRAWDLLDALPRTEPSAAFTSSTLEMVAVDAETAAATANRRRRHHRWLIGVVTGAGMIATSFLGWTLGNRLWPSPDEPLLRDLPVVERVDEYLLAEDIEFLRLLDQEGLFREEPRNAP